jgi:hypothetical protein
MVEGAPGDRYVVIADGVVTIERAGAVVTVRRAGEGFGEIALVRDTPRTATARATTTVSARTINREAFLAALGYDPRARMTAEAVADSRMPHLDRGLRVQLCRSCSGSPSDAESTADARPVAQPRDPGATGPDQVSGFFLIRADPRGRQGRSMTARLRPLRPDTRCMSGQDRSDENR